MKDQDLCNLLNRHQGPIGQVEVCREAAERIAALSPEMSKSKAVAHYTEQARLASPQVTDEQIMKLTRVIDCLEILNARPRPMCRDCADECGVCPHDDLDCDMAGLIASARALLSAPPAAETHCIACAGHGASLDGSRDCVRCGGTGEKTPAVPLNANSVVTGALNAKAAAAFTILSTPFRK
ncbi:hypothetical protein PQR63_20735 [Herbaspirillum rhizosphaerae]|uniref:Uncharacterized protein n=1 Tax=Herbaspirillum rhizosphaerae TaxID=346179 RepID=A0ABW8ZCE9_9BURK